MNLTLKIKLAVDEDVLQTIKQYTSALNYVSSTAFSENEKVSNAISLHKKFYYSVREKFDLPSQMTCSLFRDVAANYKAAKQKKGCKRKKTEHKAIVFKNTHVNYAYNKDFSLKENILSVSTINGRKEFVLSLSDYHKGILSQSVKCCDSVLCVDKRGELFFCLVVELPELELSDKGNTMGIDTGLTKMATVSTNLGKTLVVPGGKIKDKKNKYLQLRKRLQQKGTRSAKRLLKHLSGRESRYMRDVNFCTVKKILGFAKANDVAVIGIEDLTGIRKSKLRKEQRRAINSWSFYQFRFILEYKAKLAGVSVKAFDPAYTSQACSKCGFTDKTNRKTQKHFLCQSCGFSQNADINAASNIELLTRLSRFNLEDRGAVNHPDATDVDAKARFRELRLSLVASSVI